jgi:hypothetical protein
LKLLKKQIQYKIVYKNKNVNQPGLIFWSCAGASELMSR